MLKLVLYTGYRNVKAMVTNASCALLKDAPLSGVVGSTAVREPRSTRVESLIDLNLQLEIYNRYGSLHFVTTVEDCRYSKLS